MKKYNVVIKSYDDEDYRETVTKEPVDYSVAVGIDRVKSMEINENDFYIEIEEVEKN